MAVAQPKGELMKKLLGILALTSTVVLTGCIGVYDKYDDATGINVKVVSTVDMLAPSTTTVMIERPGKDEIVHAHAGQSVVGQLAPAGGQVVAAKIAQNGAKCSINCAPTNILSQSASSSQTAVDIDVY